MRFISACGSASVLALRFGHTEPTSVSWFSMTFARLRSMMRRSLCKFKSLRCEMPHASYPRRLSSSLINPGFVRICVIAAGFSMNSAPANAQTGAASPMPYGATRTCAENLDKVPTLVGLMTSDSIRRIIANEQALGQDFRTVLDQDDERRAEDAITTCPAGPRRDLLRAYVASWRGFIAQYLGDDTWRDDLNLSDQIFSVCVKQNVGTLQGARCATAIEQNARWRRAWGS